MHKLLRFHKKRVKILSTNLVATVRIVLALTVQAIRFSNNAKLIIQQLEGFGLPPNPIKPQLYQDAIDSLTDAFNTIQAHPLNLQWLTDPILPLNPIYSNDPIRIKLSDNRALLALDRINDAIRYIHTALLVSADSDITEQLLLIRFQVKAARLVLEDGIDAPPFAGDVKSR